MEYRIQEFFRQWKLHCPLDSDRVDDYSLFLAFVRLPKSHSQLQEWLNLGLQFAQWAPEVKDLPQWDYWSEEDGTPSVQHFRWAKAITSFHEALIDAGLQPDDAERMETLFKACRGPEYDQGVARLREELRWRAQDLDNRYPLTQLPEMSQVGSGPNVYYYGSVHMGDTYSAGQAGAMGPGATASHNVFQQMWAQHSGTLDLPTLASELSRLRGEMRQEAQDATHDVAVGEIAAAEKAAAEGNGPSTLSHLRAAGKWALDVASKIGVGVATAALKAALGL